MIIEPKMNYFSQVFKISKSLLRERGFSFLEKEMKTKVDHLKLINLD
jgi:hypothetical protein